MRIYQIYIGKVNKLVDFMKYFKFKSSFIRSVKIQFFRMNTLRSLRIAYVTKFRMNEKWYDWTEVIKSGKRSFSVVISFETFDVFNIIDVMLNFVELGQSFSWNNISQIFFQLHSDFNSVQWVKSVIGEWTLSCDT